MDPRCDVREDGRQQIRTRNRRCSTGSSSSFGILVQRGADGYPIIRAPDLLREHLALLAYHFSQRYQRVVVAQSPRLMTDFTRKAFKLYWGSIHSLALGATRSLTISGHRIPTSQAKP